MPDDFRRYNEARDAGAGPRAVAEAAWRDGISGIELVRLLRAVCSFPFRDAYDLACAVADAEAARLANSVEATRAGPAAPTAALLERLRAGDFRPMAEFHLNYRWTDPRWNQLPPEHLATIRPLVEARAEQLWERSLALAHALERRGDLFVQMLESEDTFHADPGAVRLWLRGLPVAAGEAVLVRWTPEDAVLADWVTFCEYWDDFCDPMDWVIVLPGTEGWVLLHRSDHRFVFGVRAGT